MEEEKKELIYLYCITKSTPPYTTFEVSGVKIYTIYFQGIYAIVSRVLPDEFDKENLKKNLNNLEWVERKTRQHETIIEETMKNSTVVPFKFATIFESEKNVEKLLREHSAEFKQTLANLEGKEEWGLKIYCDAEKFRDALNKEDERIQDIDKEILSATKGKAYLLKKKKDEVLKDIINEKISECTLDSFTRLKKTCLESKINKILPKEVTERKDEMVFNAAFLINKKRIKEFGEVLEYLKVKYSNKGLTFDCTGPWPPYNFCAISEGNK